MYFTLIARCWKYRESLKVQNSNHLPRFGPDKPPQTRGVFALFWAYIAANEIIVYPIELIFYCGSYKSMNQIHTNLKSFGALWNFYIQCKNRNFKMAGWGEKCHQKNFKNLSYNIGICTSIAHTNPTPPKKLVCCTWNIKYFWLDSSYIFTIIKEKHKERQLRFFALFNVNKQK